MNNVITFSKTDDFAATREFEETFLPWRIGEPNKHGDGYVGYLLEPTHPAVDFCAKVCPMHVWTRVDGDDGNIYITNGWHFVNRIDYIITLSPWKEFYDYEILDFLNEEETDEVP